MLQWESAAATSSANTMALMKLRKLASSGVSNLPKGIYRCILEYQMPIGLYRLTSLKKKILYRNTPRMFPLVAQLHYNVQLVGVNYFNG